MLLTDKAKAILIIVLETLFTLGLFAAGVCVEAYISNMEARVAALAFILPLTAAMGLLIGFTVSFYIDEL